MNVHNESNQPTYFHHANVHQPNTHVCVVQRWRKSLIAADDSVLFCMLKKKHFWKLDSRKLHPGLFKVGLFLKKNNNKNINLNEAIMTNLTVINSPKITQRSK